MPNFDMTLETGTNGFPTKMYIIAHAQAHKAQVVESPVLMSHKPHAKLNKIYVVFIK